MPNHIFLVFQDFAVHRNCTLISGCAFEPNPGLALFLPAFGSLSDTISDDYLGTGFLDNLHIFFRIMEDQIFREYIIKYFVFFI